jgi:hypothetical protein
MLKKYMYVKSNIRSDLKLQAVNGGVGGGGGKCPPRENYIYEF